MLDMGFDNLVYFLLCEEGVLLEVVFPGFFSKNFLVDLFSGLFRFHTKDFKRSLIPPNEMHGVKGFLKSDSLFHDAFPLTGSRTMPSALKGSYEALYNALNEASAADLPLGKPSFLLSLLFHLWIGDSMRGVSLFVV
jgi:hypothetical protein